MWEAQYHKLLIRTCFLAHISGKTMRMVYEWVYQIVEDCGELLLT